MTVVSVLHTRATDLYDALELVPRDGDGELLAALAKSAQLLRDTLATAIKTAKKAAKATLLKRVLYGPSYADALAHAGHTLIGDSGAIAIAAMLPPTLIELNLSLNDIGDAGAFAIAARLPWSLVVLQLFSNNIEDSGATAIAAQLPTSLDELNLGMNPIGDSGTTALEQAWSSRGGKFELSLDEIQISSLPCWQQVEK